MKWDIHTRSLSMLLRQAVQLNMLIFIGGDHAGYKLKETLIEYLENLSHEVIDKGPFEFDSNDDYPDFCREVAESVADEWMNVDLSNVESQQKLARGIVIGGGGQGEATVSNRVPDVRAAVFYGPREAKEAVDISGRQSTDQYEVIKLAREHNNANILSLAARFVSEDEAKHAVKIFLETAFSGDARHVRRIKKIDNLAG